MLLSIVILTKNSELTITNALNSALFADQIIIVDDYSQDKTLDLIAQIKHTNLKVYQRNLAGDFAKQRNFGLKKAKGKWVLFLDADEQISKKLSQEIISKIQNTSEKGFYLKRKDVFLGKILKYGETASVKLLRLAKSDAGLWQGKVHEVWDVSGVKAILNNPLNHSRKLSIAEFLDRINQYTDIRAKELFEKGVKNHYWQIFVYPKVKFIQNYFWRLGFLDGFRGFIFAFLMSWHSFLVRIKVIIHQSSK